METSQKVGGFGLVGLIIMLAVVATLAGGGLYYREVQKQKSVTQIGLEAEKRANELKKTIEEKQKALEQEMSGQTNSIISAVPASKNEILSSIPATEQTRLFMIAQNYIASHSVSGTEYDVVPEKVINNCVKFSVIPKSGKADPVQLFIVKANGVWTPIALGTAFPDLYVNHPECNDRDMSTWKTYRNEKYGFEVRYPLDSTIQVSDEYKQSELSLCTGSNCIKFLHIDWAPIQNKDYTEIQQTESPPAFYFYAVNAQNSKVQMILSTFKFNSSKMNQTAFNVEGDLWGYNMGDGVTLTWANVPDGTAKTYIYRAQSPVGPWIKVREYGPNPMYGPIDVVDGTKADLYYRAESIFSSGTVLKSYSVLRIPKYINE